MTDSLSPRGPAPRPAARSSNQPSGLAVVPGPNVPTLSAEPSLRSANPPAPESGIVVSEQELGSVKAQRLYKMRCDCGRSWFELELPQFVECPACRRVCLVSA